MKNRFFTMADHNRMLAAASDSRSSAEEKNFLATMASLAAANEPVPVEDYLRASKLAAINLHVEDSVFDRPYPQKNE
jgi:hypothetical protein